MVDTHLLRNPGTAMTDTRDQLSLKKGFLYTLIGSVGLSALLGILAILMGDFGEFEIRVLLTTLTISAASVCGLSCGAALEAERAHQLPLVGIGLSVLSAILLIIGVWAEPHADEFWKIAATCSVFAVAVSHVSLLRLARFSSRFTWAVPAAYATVFAVAGIISVMLWGEVDEEPMFRLLGVASILAAAITVLTPIFHRLSRGDVSSSAGATRLADVEREIRELESQLKDLRSQQERLTADADAVTLPNAPQV